MLAASSPGTYRLISLWLLPSPNRDSAVGTRLAWCSGRISACAIGMIAEGPRSTRIAATKGRADFARRYREDRRLKDTALKLGYLTAVQFGPMGAARGHDASSGVIVTAGRRIAFVVSKINGAMARRSISAFPCARRRRTPPGRRG
jgi:hypothetical protein